MGDTLPTSEITKYETLLLMTATASPEVRLFIGRDESRNVISRELTLMNTFIAKFVVINEIECRRATEVVERREKEAFVRRRHLNTGAFCSPMSKTGAGWSEASGERLGHI